VILELVDRHLVRGDHKLTISRLTDFQGHALLQIVEMSLWNDFEA